MWATAGKSITNQKMALKKWVLSTRLLTKGEHLTAVVLAAAFLVLVTPGLDTTAQAQTPCPDAANGGAANGNHATGNCVGGGTLGEGFRVENLVQSLNRINISGRIASADVATNTTLQNNNGCIVDAMALPNTITVPSSPAASCDFTSTYTDVNGDTVTITGSVDRSVSSTITNIVATGGAFGAPAAGTNPSQTVAGIQRQISRVLLSFQSNNLGDALFDHLDNIFGGGSGPVITPTGFSASTRGVANWIGVKQKQKLESQLADLPSYEDGTKVTVTPVATLLPVNQPKWNAWIRGNYTFYDGDGSSFDGHTIDVLAGFDYRVSDEVALGILGGYGNTDFDTLTGGTSGSFKADGYTVGPYAAVKIDENVQFDALAAYTYSDYDNSAGAVTGSFDAHRVTVGARLKGTWAYEGYFIEPGIRVLYAEEYQEAYTDSAGVRQSSLTIKAGRVSVGPKIGYTHRTDDGVSVKTWAAAYAEYDFSNQTNGPNSGLPDLDDLISARVSAGIDATTAEGLSIGIEGDIGGLGSGEYTSYGGTARIGLPF